MRTMRPAMVVNHLKGGGKEQFVVDLANALVDLGHAPIVVSFERGGRLASALDSDVTLVELDKPAQSSIGVVRRLAQVLRGTGATLVHSNNWGTLAESVLAARVAGNLPVVHTQHGLDYERGTRRRRSLIRLTVKRLASQRLRHLVAVSDEVRTMIVDEWRVPPDKVRVITNGVAVPPLAPLPRATRAERRLALGLPADAFVIGTVGYVRPVKDYPTLVRAFARVFRARPDTRLAIVGSGPAMDDVERAVREEGLREYVHLLGNRKDVPDLLPLFDLFAMSSLSEGISLAILEAMGRQLPVVATHVGGTPQVVVHGETGLLVPPSNEAALGEALLTLAAAPEVAAAFGIAGRRRMEEQFSALRMGRDYEHVYRTVEDPQHA